MNIKILGNNSSNRIKLVKNLNKAMDELELYANIEIVEDKNTIKNYNVSNTPALIINDKVISEGKILNDREMKKYIKLLA